jgi:1-acyl-sn-glycerol-3-phosphate acyltransferase
MADVMVILCFGRRVGRIGDLKWFVKDPVKWVPGPGWGMKFLDCVYVKRDWAKDADSIRRVFGKYVQERIPISLVSFLEGTRRTPAKQARAVAFAEKRGLEPPRHTLVPRTKGFLATLDGLGDHLDAVYDMTIVYPDGVPSLLDCFMMRVPRVDVYFRRFPMSVVPNGRDARDAWVRALFREKDALVGGFSATSGFPVLSVPAWRTGDEDALRRTSMDDLGSAC